MQIPTLEAIKILVVTVLLLLGPSLPTAVPYPSENKSLVVSNGFLQRLLEYNKNYEDSASQLSKYSTEYGNIPSAYISAPLYKMYQSNIIPSDGSKTIEEFEREVNPVSKLPSNVFSELATQRVVPDILRQEELVEEMEDSIVHRRHVSPRLSKREKRKRRKEEKRRLRAQRKYRRQKKKEASGLKWAQVLQMEGASRDIDGELFGDCCPSEQIVIRKKIGKNRDNHAVDIKPGLFTYERICNPQVVGKECVFPGRTMRRGVVTRCAQYYSWSQTLVRAYKSQEDWHLDFISVRAGCSCQISNAKRKRKRKRRKRKLTIDDVPLVPQSQTFHNITQY